MKLGVTITMLTKEKGDLNKITEELQSNSKWSFSESLKF